MAQGDVETVLGIEDHVATAGDGDGWIAQPDGTLVSGASGHAIDGAADLYPGASWRSADLAQPNTLAIHQWSRQRRLGAGVAHGLNLSEQALVRMVAGPWVAREMVALDVDAGDDITVGLTSTADFTCWIKVRVHPYRDPDATSTDALLTFGTVSGASSDYSIRVDSSPAGTLLATLSRFSGSGLVHLASSQVLDDGKTWWEIAVRCKNSTTTAELLLDGVSQDSDATITAHAGGTGATLTVGSAGGSTSLRFDIAELGIVDEWVDDATLGKLTGRTAGHLKGATGAERGLGPLWRMGGSGTAVDDLAAADDGTIGGTGARGWFWNPTPPGDTGTVQPWGPWLARRALRLVSGTSVYATRAIADVRSATLTADFRADSDLLPDSGVEGVIWLGPGTSPVTADDLVQVQLSSGNLKVSFRNTVSLAAPSGTPLDGEWHRLQARINGRSDAYEVLLDGNAILSGTGGSWASTAQMRLGVVGPSEGWLEVSELRAWEVDGDFEEHAYRRVAVYEEPAMLAYLPLDAESTEELVADATVTTAGTLTWVDRERTDSDADDEEFFPGHGVGVADPADRLATAPQTVVGWWDAVDAEEAAVIITDPLGASYVEASYLTFLSTLALSQSRLIPRASSRLSPGVIFSPLGSPLDELGEKGDVVDVELWLTAAQADAVGRRIRARGLQRPVLVVSSGWFAEARRLVDSVYGHLTAPPQITQDIGSGTDADCERYRCSLSIRRLERTSWR
ncbi:MAG: hypothetical protein GY719_25950 [bacterium]|nr:hypothetical protein [bacterium]